MKDFQGGKIIAHREEVSIFHSPEENNRHQCQIAAQDYSSREDFFKFPAVGQRGWFHSVLGYCHDRAYIIRTEMNFQRR